MALKRPSRQLKNFCDSQDCGFAKFCFDAGEATGRHKEKRERAERNTLILSFIALGVSVLSLLCRLIGIV